MRVFRVLIGALVLVILVAPVERSSAEAGRYEGFHVDVGPVSERDSRVVLTITSACDGDIPYQFWTGRRAPAGATIVSQSSFDARGSAATPGADYVEQSGSFTLSKSKRVTIEVPLVDNSTAEPLEHVVILFESPVQAGVIAGDTYRCTSNAADPDRTYIESAFTIVDDDPAAANDSGPPAAAAPSGSSGPKRPASGAGTATTTPGQPAPRATPSPVVPANDEIRSAAGVKLVGAALASKSAGDSGPRLPAAAAALLVLLAAGAWLRWRRTW